MRISERIEGTITSWAERWKELLRGWMISVLSLGFDTFFNIIAKAAAPKLKPLIDKVEREGAIPPELKPFVDELKAPKGQVGALFAQSAGGALIGGVIGNVIEWLLLDLTRALSKSELYRIPSPEQALALWLRKEYEDGGFEKDMAFRGFHPNRIKQLQALTQIRLDPMSVITAWRRDPAKYEKLFEDLKQQGWSDDRIEALKFFTLYYPTPAELIHWTAREVFEPSMIEKYGLKEGIGRLRRDDFYKAGMDDTQIDNHWIAHWEHASWMQLVEMLHRHIIEEQDVKDWFPLVEMAPYWADNLIKVAYAWPTRVDVRRWWDMRTIDEARLKELYEGMGYRDKNLDDYIKWTKVYVDFPMMMTRFKSGWITEEDVREWLRELEIPEDRITQFIEEKTKPEKPARVEKERDMTATEIMKGVKKGILTPPEGVELLMDMGYDETEAELKLQIYGAVEAGSPEGYTEFKQLTQLYRKALGLEAKIPPAELAEAEKALIDAEAELKRLRAEGVKEEKLAPYYEARDNTAYRYRQLLAKWKEER